MEIAVRPEHASDRVAIRLIHDAAFGQPDEGRIVDGVRGTADSIDGGSIVAVMDGQLIGHLLLSRGALVAANGSRREIWMLGPIAVLPAYQQLGAGQRSDAGCDTPRPRPRTTSDLPARTRQLLPALRL